MKCVFLVLLLLCEFLVPFHIDMATRVQRGHVIKNLHVATTVKTVTGDAAYVKLCGTVNQNQSAVCVTVP
jgi:hypothetical protein